MTYRRHAHAARVASDARPILLPARFDPETRVGAEREARVVGTGAFGAQPPALEERRRDVATVTDHVHRDRLRIGQEHRPQDEARLRRLLDAAQATRETKAPDTLEDRP